MPFSVFGFKQTLVIPAACVVILFFSACNDPNVVGLDVLPASDRLNLGFNTNTALVTSTVREDSVRSDETSLMMLGSYADPVFGQSLAGFYTQLRLPTNNINFGQNLLLDSVVLTLTYSGYYGDISTPQTIRVYEVTDDMYQDSSYYSNKTFGYNPAAVGSGSFLPHPSDSVPSGSENLAPHLRIKLNNAFGQKLLSADSASLSTNDNFLQYMKGIYVAVDPVTTPGSGAILSFSPLASYTKLTIYYSNAVDDSLNFSFVITDACARINHFEHDYSGTPVDNALSTASLGDSLVYVQAMAGVKTKITMPMLGHLIDSGTVAVNKAEIVASVDPSSFGLYSPPSRLYLLRADSAGRNSNIPDELYESESYYGGTYNASTGEYRFNIARHVQEVLNGGFNDYGLYLVASASAVSANRVILSGGKNSSLQKMRLELTYTKLH